MGRRRVDAVTATVLGGLSGLILGGGLGGLAGWWFAVRAAAGGPQGVAIFDILMTIVFWAAVIIGTGAGAHFGALVGAVVGAGIATRPADSPTSEDEPSHWEPE
jgi:hypothetical protein